MPTTNLEYPKQPYNKVNRYDSRATYALETIHQIVNSCPILHVSFSVPDSPFPTILPMIGQMGSFDRPSADTGDVLELYLHGYVSSRLVNLSRNASSNDDGKEGEEVGLPICVAASLVDGLVLSLTPNSHSYNYRSATLFGRATLVTDPDEKLYAMRLITNSVVRARYEHTRTPPSAAEMQSTGVLRVRVAAGSAKLRTGMPSDDKADTGNDALLGRVWTGVVPVHYTLGEPIPGPYNRVQEVPPYLREYVDETNRYAEEWAVEEATKPMVGKTKLDREDD
ncbi:uncharacterized protein F4812DRAFT_411110 [Daldinia caldariorum]|uniref:uncharacterized protein n=1 Tax=Daldinia caldariorum TaxID=326644 RepID=UPI002008CE1D|nr:uncharacterized protein F4812DRAFT_411110 [Daldinia caldariorum]KAI1472970.1 hypothetical protein F4812DRAFT_411110 [Daldinia caldariorum]